MKKGGAWISFTEQGLCRQKEGGPKMANVGVDLHKTQFTVCVRGRGGEKFQKYPTTNEGYQECLKKAASWQKAGHEVGVEVESTGNTRYFKGRMEAAGVKVVVINTLKFKVVNESVKKTDKHDAATIAEFLEKDMLPESRLCGKTSEELRRLVKSRTTLVCAEKEPDTRATGEGVKASLQSKRGRKQVLDAPQGAGKRARQTKGLRSATISYDRRTGEKC
jgi:transposase